MNISWSKWLRWDLRTIIALLVGLGLVITWTLAAPDSTALATFDFGTSSSADIETGAIGVMGGASVYPKHSGNFSYGWDLASIQAVSHGTAVADKLNRDYNFLPGGGNGIFKVSGLDAGNYNFRFYVGDSVNKVATQITVGGRTATVIKTASYGTADLPVSVASTADVVSMEFASAATDAGWVINAVRIYSSSTAPSDPSFSVSVSPSTQTVRAGGIAVYQVGITPLNQYGSPIDLTMSGLVAGITAELIPPRIIDLPGSAQLRITTSDSTAALPYEFLLKAKGTDSLATTKNVVVRLTVTEATGGLSGVPTGTDPGATTSQPTSQVPGESQSLAEIRTQFRNIDEYVAAEAQKLVTKNNTTELQGIANDFVAFPVAPDLPPPTSVAERSLQFLTRTGIIGTVVDNAPQGVKDTGPKSFLRRILDSLVPSSGG